MIGAAINLIDWFIPASARLSKWDLGRARTFVVAHLAGSTGGLAIAVFLKNADPDPGFHVALIFAGVLIFASLPFALKTTGDLTAVGAVSTQTLLAAGLVGVYFYGGANSPFLPWLLIALANGLFYLSDNPESVLAIFVANMIAFLCVWRLSGALPHGVAAERLSGAGVVSVACATLYMAWLAIFYGRLLTLESALEREAARHRDTSERLKLANRRAERANREKSAFVARMSHELRTPLNAVIGYSEMLIEDCHDVSPSLRRSNLERVNAAGKHLLSMVKEALDASDADAEAGDVGGGVNRPDLKTQVSDFGAKGEAAGLARSAAVRAARATAALGAQRLRACRH